jgi:hypothetical protein
MLMGGAMTTEKRRHPRIDALSLLSYVLRDENGVVVEEGMGRTVNVNEGGILLETHAPINPQYDVFLAIGLEDDLIEVNGKVVHQSEDEDGTFKTGIRFLKTEANALQILRKFIKAFEKQR